MKYDIELIAKIVISRREGRDIVFWGAHQELLDDLNRNGIVVKYIFTGNENLLNSDTQLYKPLRELNGNSYKYFLILPYFMTDKLEWQLSMLEEWEYQYDKDFLAIQPSKEWIISKDNYKLIRDGNRVIGCPSGVRISVYGIDNQVVFKNIALRGKLEIKIKGSHNRIIIENGCELNGNGLIVINGNRHNIYLGNDTKFTDLRVSCLIENSKLVVNNHATFMRNTTFTLHKDDIIEIGQDCMISFDVVFQVGDGHSIFDILTRKNINCGVKAKINGISYSSAIQLGRHVWVGRRSTILGGNTIVRDGCIIGAETFVKGQFNYNNVVIAGVPGKIKRKNVAWSRKNFSENILDCGEYIVPTDDGNIIETDLDLTE